MKNQKGFSAIEFFIALFILGIIAAIVIPGIRLAKQQVDQEKHAGTPEDDSAAAQVLKGEHKLRKMFSGSYFLLVPRTAGTQNSTTISFAWPLKDGTYAISSLPLEKIRIRFDEAADEPTIRFAWRYENFTQIDYLMEHAIIYATITVREKDWPQ